MRRAERHHHQEPTMIGIILALMLPTTSAHADWCSGVVVSNGVCSEFTVPPAIVGCDYYDSSTLYERFARALHQSSNTISCNGDTRCAGVGREDRRSTVERPNRKSPR